MSSLNFERKIAVITDGNELNAVIAEFDCHPVFFKTTELSQIDSQKFDAMILGNLEIKHDVTSDRLIRKFQSLSLPIAAIGKSVAIVAKIFGPDGLEVASSDDPVMTRAFEKSNAVITDCPPGNYISDRDHKLLTTSGTHLEGIRKLLREFTEMA